MDVSLQSQLSDWFFKNEKKGIILEDDCIPSISFFLDFVFVTLNKFESNKKVGKHNWKQFFRISKLK